MFDLNKIPFLRLLIPFCLGIILQLNYAIHPFSGIVLTVLFLILTGLFFIKQKSKQLKHAFVFGADLLLFTIGLNLAFHTQTINQPYYFGDLISNDSLCAIVEVNDVPVQKAKTRKVEFKVIQLKHRNSFVACNGKLLAYLQNSQLTQQINCGQLILMKTRIREIEEPKNLHTFNFKNYFSDRGIYHSAYADSNSFRILADGNSSSLWQIGIGIKSKIIHALKNSGLSAEAYAICAALITGYDDDIDQDVMESFSHSGTLHVLSVSGLHVGLIYLVLNFLFSLVDLRSRHKIVQLVTVTFILWFFALITGFSAPVLRSVIMFSLLGVGNLFFRNRPMNQLNILFVSAFVLLFYDPLLIRNVGFLLSYSALFGIIYFHPMIKVLYTPKNKVSSYLWESVVLSVSATISTLPITLLVFHQFPIWFALANIVVVPATFALLLLGFVALFKISAITWFVNQLTVLLISFIKLFNSDSYAFIDRIDFDVIDSFCLIICILLLTTLLFKRQFRYVVTLLCFVIAWQLYSLSSSYQKKTMNELVIYHTPKQTTISVKNQTDLYISQLDTINYKMQVKPTVVSYNYPDQKYMDFNSVQFKQVSLLLLSKKHQLPANLNKKFSHLLVSNNAVPNAEIFAKWKFKLVVADASNSDHTLRKMEQLCAKNNVPFYNIKHKGAFVLSLM